MADIFVDVAPGAGCLKVLDLETEGAANSLESGVALRKVLHTRTNDTINWWALQTAGPLTISFPLGSPFSGALTTTTPGRLIKVASGPLSGAAGRFKYTITLGPVGSAINEDPQIIVDTGSISVELEILHKERK